MNSNDLFCAIADVDPELLRESAQFSTVSSAIQTARSRQRGRLAAGGVAFAVCLTAFGIARSRGGDPGSSVLTAPSGTQVSSAFSRETAGTDDSSRAESKEPGATSSGADGGEAADLSGCEWMKRADVVWGTAEYKGIAEPVPMGTAKISGSLSRLMEGKDAGTVYAVLVDFSSGIPDAELNNWEYNGKTVSGLQRQLAELMKPAENARTYQVTDSEGNVSVGYLPPAENEAKIAEIVREIRAIRKAFIEQKFSAYAGSFRRQGLEVYTDARIDLSEQPVFYTFATRAQLENFSCGAQEAFVFLPACRLK